MSSSSNQVCVIDGDYTIGDTKNNTALTELLAAYKSTLNIKTAENSPDYSKFALIHSKDGSELCSHLLASFGLLHLMPPDGLERHPDGGDESSSDMHTQTPKLQQRTHHHSSYTNFICFIVSDFDHESDRVFAKLEETQLKLGNFLSGLNQA
jgi:hypothetical protein